jgi:5-methylthioribose kinase
MEWPLDLDRYFVKECYKLKERCCCPEASPLVFYGDLKQQMSSVTGLDLEKGLRKKV